MIRALTPRNLNKDLSDSQASCAAVDCCSNQINFGRGVVPGSATHQRASGGSLRMIVKGVYKVENDPHVLADLTSCTIIRPGL